MQEELDIYLKCYRDKYNKALENDESIAVTTIHTLINFIDDDWNTW